MTATQSIPNQLQDRVAQALCSLDALESAYETVTVGQLVSLRARTHGSATAIDIFERGERATYIEMDRRSNSYAHALRTFGVRKGDRIGVMLPNRIEFPILWFAFAKLGAAIVPINMRYTAREIEYILSDTQAKFAIVDESAWSAFSAMDPWPRDLAKERVILVGQPSDATAATLDSLLKGVDDSPVDEDVRPDDLLNIQYTSGTTGFPKGCMLTHDYWGVFSYAFAYLDYQPYERYLCWSPFFYGYAQVLLLRSYRQGGTLYVAQQLSSSRFIDWLKMYRIEWCALPRLIAQAADDIPSCLRQASQYDGWSADTIRRIRERFGVRGHNFYGMTEIGQGTQCRLDIDDAGSHGLRAPFRELRLVNEDGSPTPIGKVGELWVRGRAIFKGYWNKPDANAEFFEREWFKTGDLMRRDELGFHWLVGRKKDMIRRSSENIAAREVEAVIREIAEIADVAAVPVRDAKRGEEVKIYVELKEGVRRDDLPVERILQHARARLAVFKVPRYIAFTSALPRTVTSNKVLKRELMAVSDPLSGTYDSEEGRWR
ncbi:class I adenylate-forming enzyme family protein [Bradyrhizobium sp. BR 1433]|uniref:class I adenylate-forming enzyme family protein n=1 Tax=Bradyrhizobium sp. BR 1433 TaxID=3447967 RepID=UPI003EE60F87